MDIISILIVVGVLIFSLVIHEIAHGLMAYFLGDDTAKISGRLTLNPAAHLEPILSIFLPAICVMMNVPVIGGAKPVPVNPRNLKGGEWGMALVAFAGPFSNFVMAFFAFGVMAIFNINTGFWALFCGYFIRINLGLMLFNLLPIPPLDGSKIIFPLAPNFVQDGIRKLEQNSMYIFPLILLFSTQISQVINIGMVAILEFFVAIFQ